MRIVVVGETTSALLAFGSWKSFRPTCRPGCIDPTVGCRREDGGGRRLSVQPYLLAAHVKNSRSRAGPGPGPSSTSCIPLDPRTPLPRQAGGLRPPDRGVLTPGADAVAAAQHAMRARIEQPE